MAKPNSPVLEISELYQVCVVVHDLEKSIEHYRDVLGVGPWETLEGDSSTFSDVTYHGRPVEHRFRVGLAMVGPMQLELIQPVEGDNIFSDFLNEHGEGLHHLGHARVKNLDEAVERLEKAGFPCLQGARFPGGGYAYMDTTKALGTILELLELPEGVPAPGTGQ